MSATSESRGQRLSAISPFFADAEIERASKKRDASVDAPRRERLLRANRAQRDAAFIADEVVAGLSSGQREISRLDHPAAGEPCNELRVIVVRVSTDDQHARRDGETVDEPMQLHRASILSGKSRHDRELNEKTNWAVRTRMHCSGGVNYANSSYRSRGARSDRESLRIG